MKCIMCGTECVSECCSGKCRARKSRRTRTAEGARSPAHARPKLPGKGIAETYLSDKSVKEFTATDSPNIAKIRGDGDGDGEGIPNYGQPDCQCKHCQQHRTVAGSKRTLNHGPYKTADQLAEHEGNRVSLPGDADYKCSPAVAIANTPAVAQAGAIQ